VPLVFSPPSRLAPCMGTITLQFMLTMSFIALPAAEVDAMPPSGAVSTVLLLVPSPGPLSPDQTTAVAAELLPAVSALLLGLSVPATVVPDEQVSYCACLL